MADKGVMDLTFAMTIEGLDDFKREIAKLENLKIDYSKITKGRQTKRPSVNVDTSKIERWLKINKRSIDINKILLHNIKRHVDSLTKDVTKLVQFNANAPTAKQVGQINQAGNLLKTLNVTPKQVSDQLNVKQSQATTAVQGLFKDMRIKTMLYQMRKQNSKIDNLTQIIEGVQKGNRSLKELYDQTRTNSLEMLKEILTGKEGLKSSPEFQIPGGMGKITTKTGKDIKRVRSIKGLKKSNLTDDQIEDFLGTGKSPDPKLMRKAFEGKISTKDLKGVKLEAGRTYPRNMIQAAMGRAKGVDSIRSVSTARKFNLLVKLNKEVNPKNLDNLIKSIKKIKGLSAEGKRLLEWQLKRIKQPFQYLQMESTLGENKWTMPPTKGLQKTFVPPKQALNVATKGPPSPDFDAFDKRIKELSKLANKIAGKSADDYLEKELDAIHESLSDIRELLRIRFPGKGSATQQTRGSY